MKNHDSIRWTELPAEMLDLKNRMEAWQMSARELNARINANREREKAELAALVARADKRRAFMDRAVITCAVLSAVFSAASLVCLFN